MDAPTGEVVVAGQFFVAILGTSSFTDLTAFDERCRRQIENNRDKNGHEGQAQYVPWPRTEQINQRRLLRLVTQVQIA